MTNPFEWTKFCIVHYAVEKDGKTYFKHTIHVYWKIDNYDSFMEDIEECIQKADITMDRFLGIVSITPIDNL